MTLRTTYRIVIHEDAVDTTSELKLDPVRLIPRHLHCSQFTITSDRLSAGRTRRPMLIGCNPRKSAARAPTPSHPGRSTAAELAGR